VITSLLLVLTTNIQMHVFQLGDKVKISVSKRKFKQYHPRSWNELISKVRHTNTVEQRRANKPPKCSRTGDSWPVTVFSVVRGSIQEKSSNVKIPPTYYSKS